MSTDKGVGTFHHYDRDGGVPVMRKLTTRPVIDRIASTTPRTKYKGEGLAPGSWVTGHGKRAGSGGYFGGGSNDTITGQVWCAADGGRFGPGYWWVATTDGVYYLAHGSQLGVIGQAGDDVDVPMFEASA